MDNFNIYPKTNIFFGTNQLVPFFDAIQKLHYKNILLTYGHRNIKKVGLYDKVIEQFKRINTNFFEHKLAHSLKNEQKHKRQK